MFALFINAAILIMAAATFHGTGHEDVADIGDAYMLLSPLLGTTMASTLFAVALLCSGQNATLTGTLAGQIVMEGFLNLRLRPWLRRLITRLIAIIPAVIVVCIYGEQRHRPAAHPQPGDPEPAAAVRRVSAGDVHERSAQDGRSSSNPLWVKVLAWSVAVIIAALNVWLLYQTFVGLIRCTNASSSRSRTPPPTARSSTHVSELARLTGAALLLVHVADGWAARNFEELKLRESEEMQADRAYLGAAARRARRAAASRSRRSSRWATRRPS